MNFSKQLKKYRELNGYSQEILAEKIYVTRQTISKRGCFSLSYWHC